MLSVCLFGIPRELDGLEMMMMMFCILMTLFVKGSITVGATKNVLTPSARPKNR